MKAILILDMPKTCSDCPLSYFADPDDYENDTMYCKVHNGYMEDAFNIRAVWCPLKPMPLMEVDQVDTERDEWMDGYETGWDACIEEIEE